MYRPPARPARLHVDRADAAYSQGESSDDLVTTTGAAPLRLGVCAMEKKASSKPMKAILELLVRTGEFEVVPFPEKSILEDPVESWPHPVEVLISFFSDGFPLDKAEAYVELRRPHVINNLTAQRILLDRRKVYALLRENGIPHPQAVIVERDPVTKELVGESATDFEEGDDFVRVGDRKVNKPFVEKPVDAEDHNICIYYASSNGGGVKRLFRKVGDRSSEFDQEASSIRSDGTYMYEAFMQTQGTDIKVYTVGPEYAHAEARKSPVIDGVVQRDGLGKELRFPVVLTAKEKEIARRVCLAFGQTVCGFDLLRTEQGSYVIDVNGWSFVKGLQRYYEDAAMVLRKHMLSVTGRRQAQTPHTMSMPSSPDVQEAEAAASMDRVQSERTPGVARKRLSADRWERQELLAVLAVMRHGDRTPKNKMKLTTRRREFLKLHKNWATGPQKEVKLKAPKQLQEVLDITNSMLRGRPAQTSDSEPSGDLRELPGVLNRCFSLDEQEAEAVQLIRAVLETGGHFDGIYRKVQLKPTAWHADGSVQELLLVLKYGGIITPAGVVQAENLGHTFRGEMYPGKCAAAAEEGEGHVHSNGLLRLHATQRHDFKVYSSDEGRVQMTAAAFTRGLLDLEKGNLTPICAALVQIDPMTLDDLPKRAQPLLEEAKSDLYAKINGAGADASPAAEKQEAEETTGSQSPPYGWRQMYDDLGLMMEKVEAVVQELKGLDKDEIESVDCAAVTRARKSLFKKDTNRLDSPGRSAPSSPSNRSGSLAEGMHPGRRRACCSTCKPILCLKRWEKLREDLWDKKKKNWNISKAPEIHDAVKYDLIHQSGLASAFADLCSVSKRLNDAIVPRECGPDELSRARIGGMVCQRLVRKLLIDMTNCLVTPAAEELPPSNLVTAEEFLARQEDSRDKSQPMDAVPVPVSNESALPNEAEFAGLDASRSVAALKSPHRRVRTRLYFTSESHIQTLMNVLRYCHLAQDDPGGPDTDERVVCPEAEGRLAQAPVFEYLSQIVLRLYEDKNCDADSPERYKVEVLFSPGADGDPESANQDHAMALAPLQPLHETGRPLTLAQVRKLLGPFAEEPQAGCGPADSPAAG